MRTSLLLAAALSTLACGGGPTTGDASIDAGLDGAIADAATDAAQPDAAQPDAAQPDAAQPDAAQPDAAQPDAAQPDAAQPDAGPYDGGPTEDAGPLPDAGPPVPCVAAGGTCVPVIPDSCPDGIFGDPGRFSCGGGLGVACCIPRTRPPDCLYVGTRSEGWYAADGRRICYANCARATATCEAIGTRSEGWYATPPEAACNTFPVERLIEWAFCAP